MERTITFIAEHKKREYEQIKDGTDIEIASPQDPKDVDLEPEPHTSEY